jgi:hypothetical protein
MTPPPMLIMHRSQKRVPLGKAKNNYYRRRICLTAAQLSAVGSLARGLGNSKHVQLQLSL